MKYSEESKLIDNCLARNQDVFEAVKNKKNPVPEPADNVNGKTGSDFPKEFMGIYSELFNRVEDKEEVDEVMLKINELMFIA